MENPKKYPLNLYTVLKYGKHAGKTIQWVIDNDIEHIKSLVREKRIVLEVLCFDYLVIKNNELKKNKPVEFKRGYKGKGYR